MKNKVFDIVAPKDNWGRNYAHMEHQRIVDHDLWQPCTYIEVKYWQPSPTYLKALEAMRYLEALAKEMGWDK